MKRTQCCIKLFPHRREVDKKTLSKPVGALHCDGRRGLMNEKEGERGGERGRREKKRGETEREGRQRTHCEDREQRCVLLPPSTLDSSSLS